LLSLLFAGGWLMLPLFLFSVYGVYLFMERFLSLRRISSEFGIFRHKLKALYHSNQQAEVEEYCQKSDHVAAAMISSDQELTALRREVRRENLETIAMARIGDLENSISNMATLSGIAPLTGFLGTVTGMIQAFMRIQELAGNVNAGVLAGGIWEALITTAVGLLIGIVALIAYNYLQSMVAKITTATALFGQEILKRNPGSGDAN
jgi:biopolymer transport protein ExbB